MILKTIFLTLGILALVKAMAVLLFKKSLINWALRILKKEKNIRELVLIEVVFALILLILAYCFR